MSICWSDRLPQEPDLVELLLILGNDTIGDMLAGRFEEFKQAVEIRTTSGLILSGLLCILFLTIS